MDPEQQTSQSQSESQKPDRWAWLKKWKPGSQSKPPEQLPQPARQTLDATLAYLTTHHLIPEETQTITSLDQLSPEAQALAILTFSPDARTTFSLNDIISLIQTRPSEESLELPEETIQRISELAHAFELTPEHDLHAVAEQTVNQERILEDAQKKYDESEKDMEAARRVKFEKETQASREALRDMAVPRAIQERERQLREWLTSGQQRYFIIDPGQRDMLRETLHLDQEAVEKEIFERVKKVYYTRLGIHREKPQSEQ